MSTHASIRSRISALCLSAAPLILSVLVLVGCGDTSHQSNNTGTTTGSAFVIGTDAPLASVVSFSTTIQSVNAIDASGNTASLVSGTPTVDFARFNGLQTLIDMNDVPADTYTQIAVTFSSATIGYLQTGSGAPSIQTMPATFVDSSGNAESTYTYTETLANPLIVAASGPVGLHVDFRLDKSIQVTNGQITGNVTPTLQVNAVGPSDAGAYIDEFIAGVVNPTASSQSFTIQGPHGRVFTVNVSGSTEWDNGDTLSDLTSTSIVQISGILDRADSTIDADEVAILSQNSFYAAGQITYVQPSSSAASNFQLYVRGTLPASGDGVTDGSLATVDLSGSEKYFIYWMHNPLTEFLFNSSTLLPGQHVSVGGTIAGAASDSAVSVKRIVLRNWGFNGTLVASSVNSGGDNFQMNINGFAGLLVPGQPVTVYVGAGTKFRDGFTQLSDLTSATNIRVVGLLIKDPTSGNSVILARYVDDMNN